MNFLLTFLIISLTSFSNKQVQEEQVEIMFVGFDHLSQMDNGTESSNIFSKKKQKEIQQLTKKLEAFQPDMLMVELEPQEQKSIDSLFNLYKTGEQSLQDFENGAGETMQIGFRMAKDLQLPGVVGVNYYDSTSQSLLKEGKNIEIFQEALKKLQQTARPLKQKVQTNELSIYDYIKTMNQPEFIDLTHHLIFNLPAYIQQGKFSEKGNYNKEIPINNEYIGAEYISLFYNRNLKIYSNILNKQLETGNKKLLVIIGQAHVGVLQDLVEENPTYKITSVVDYL